MNNPFSVGDKIKFKWARLVCKYYIRPGNVYTVQLTTMKEVWFVDDNGDDDSVAYEDVMLASPNVVVTRCTSTTAGDAGSYASTTPDCHEEDDTSRTSSSSTSEGLFDKGDTVVYKDGTAIPNDEGYFVVDRCTATAIWFEHCWSVPFNPNEFRLGDECYDDCN